MNDRARGAALRALVAALAMVAAWPAWCAQSDDDVGAEMKKLPWQSGPATGEVGSRARIRIPDDASLLAESSGGKFLELTGNLPEDGETILVHGDWWATLSFADSGYVKDDEKLDADKLLAALKANQDEANAERRKRGMPELFNDGWIVPPHYDPKTRFLEYGLKLRASDSPRTIVNYTMRLLSRHGYETVTLVTGPATLERDVQDLHKVLQGFDFNAGETYGEFRPGDHVAEFGLGALVLGGAAAAAVKAGWFKGVLAALVAGWKLVAAAVAALVASIGRIFRRGSK